MIFIHIFTSWRIKKLTCLEGLENEEKNSKRCRYGELTRYLDWFRVEYTFRPLFTFAVH